MTFGIAATVGAVATLGGAYLSSRATKDAANTQADSAAEASEMQYFQAQEAIKVQQDQLNKILANADETTAKQIQTQLDQLTNQLGVNKQTYDATLRTGATTRDQQLAVANQTRRAQLGVAGQTRDQLLGLSKEVLGKQEGAYSPYQQAGLAGQNRLMEYLGIGGNAGAQGYGDYATAEFTPEAFAAGQDPGYGFRMSEGLKAVDRQAAARGGLISGAALKASQRFGQDMASQEFQNAYNRFQTTRNNTLAPYQSMQGVGLNAATGMAGAAGTYGQTSGNALGDYGTQGIGIEGNYGIGRSNAYGSYGNMAIDAEKGYGAGRSSGYNAYGQNVSNIQGRQGDMIGNALQRYGDQVTGALTGYGNAFAANTMGAGNAIAAGQIGSANAINQGISGVTNQYYQNQMLNMFKDRSKTTGEYMFAGGGAP
jgi:hypothetical protein